MTAQSRTIPARRRWRWALLAMLAVLAAALAPGNGVAADLLKVRLAVGGANCLCYLPVVLANQMGFFKDAGVDIELQNFRGGSQAATAVLGGSSDVVCGYYDHTVDLQPKQKFMQAIIVYDRFPGFVLAVSPKQSGVASVKDLAGKKVGVTAPGSSTDFFVKYVLRKAGVDPAQVAIVGIGADATALAALEQGAVDAGVVLDPIATLLVDRNPQVKLLIDARTEADSLKVFGGQYPAGSLYAEMAWVEKHPKESQGLVEGVVRALQWIRNHTPEEVMAKMPEEYVGPDKKLYLAALKNTLPMYSPTALMDLKSAQVVLDIFSQSVPEIADAKIDLSKTYTNQFVEAANKKLGVTN